MHLMIVSLATPVIAELEKALISDGVAERRYASKS